MPTRRIQSGIARFEWTIELEKRSECKMLLLHLLRTSDTDRSIYIFCNQCVRINESSRRGGGIGWLRMHWPAPGTPPSVKNGSKIILLRFKCSSPLHHSTPLSHISFSAHNCHPRCPNKKLPKGLLPPTKSMTPASQTSPLIHDSAYLRKRRVELKSTNVSRACSMTKISRILRRWIGMEYVISSYYSLI